MIIRTTVEENEYVYYEKFFSGQRELIVNGVGLIKMTKKLFLNEVDGERHTYAVLGNRVFGLSLETENDERIVLTKNTWYDWLLMFLPLLGFFGVFFGAISGILSIALNTVAIVANGFLIRSGLKLPARITISILIIIVVNVLWVFLSIIVLGHLILAALRGI